MRALVFFAAALQDRVEMAGGHGDAQAAELDSLNDLMLPLLKGWCSERGTEWLSTALQVIGGSGYLQDYPFEQYLRDQKIDSLYEGTTHIQALDLLFRKILRDQGKTLMGLLARIGHTLEAQAGGEALAPERKLLERAVADVMGTLQALQGKMAESGYHAGLQGNRVLLMLADLVAGWQLVVHAAVALERRPGARAADKTFYEGKIASARWFCRNVLPTATLTRKLVEAGDLLPLEVPEEAFG
jgi:hypothetical protein